MLLLISDCPFFCILNERKVLKARLGQERKCQGFPSLMKTKAWRSKREVLCKRTWNMKESHISWPGEEVDGTCSWRMEWEKEDSWGARRGWRHHQTPEKQSSNEDPLLWLKATVRWRDHRNSQRNFRYIEGDWWHSGLPFKL